MQVQVQREIIADSALRNSHSGCSGGALHLNSNSQQDPFATNVTISRTAFVNNHADNNFGSDIYVWRGDNQGAVPCPTPGKLCAEGFVGGGDGTTATHTESSAPPSRTGPKTTEL